MTVCILDEEYRKTKNGILDLTATISFLQRISDFLDTIKLEEVHGV